MEQRRDTAAVAVGTERPPVDPIPLCPPVPALVSRQHSNERGASVRQRRDKQPTNLRTNGRRRALQHDQSARDSISTAQTSYRYQQLKNSTTKLNVHNNHNAHFITAHQIRLIDVHETAQSRNGNVCQELAHARVGSCSSQRMIHSYYIVTHRIGWFDFCYRFSFLQKSKAKFE